MARGQRRPIVPECDQVLNKLKYEIAAELGLSVGKHMSFDVNSEFATELGANSNSSNSEYWGHIASRDTGAVGGAITAHLIRQAQGTLV